MPSLLETLESLRGTFNKNPKELQVLDILIRIARESAEGDTWHSLQVRAPEFKALTQAEADRIMADPGVPQIIVKGEPPAQAYIAYPIARDGGNGNAQQHE